LSIGRQLFLRAEWNVGIVEHPIEAFLEPGFEPEIRWLPDPGSGKILADPFGRRANGSLHILCEALDYGPRKGIIASVRVDGTVVSPPEVVLELPWHLSYPFLMEHGGQIYCIPESFRAREAALYRAEAFPHRWTRLATLVENLAVVDATIVRHGGRWWLFHTDQDLGPHDTLFIRHAADLLGPWQPHALAPAKVDAASARPGGTPFVHHGTLYRPAQDCSKSYGRRVVINRVTKLSETEFHEEPVAFVGPFRNSPYPDGVHTLSAVDRQVTLLDAKRDRFIPRALRAAFGRVLRGALTGREAL
jgi:hypothetical protein